MSAGPNSTARMKGCKDCLYRAATSSGSPFCNYLERTGMTRTGQGAVNYPGGGCSLYKPRAHHRKHANMAAVRSAERMKCWQLGMTDVELAAATGVTESSVRQWRNRYSLDENIKEGEPE